MLKQEQMHPNWQVEMQPNQIGCLLAFLSTKFTWWKGGVSYICDNCIFLKVSGLSRSIIPQDRQSEAYFDGEYLCEIDPLWIMLQAESFKSTTWYFESSQIIRT